MATRKKGHKKTTRRKTSHKGSSTVKTQIAHVIKSLQTIKKHV